MRNNVKRIVRCSIFITAWSVIEIVIGSLLHQIPGRAIPTGSILIIFIIPLLTVFNRLDSKVGIITFIGIITGILKLFSIGGVKFVPAFSIVIEAAVFDIFVHIIPRKLAAVQIIGSAILCGAAGTTIASTIGSYILGMFNGKSIIIVLPLILYKALEGVAGGIIGGSVSLIILKRLNEYFEQI